MFRENAWLYAFVFLYVGYLGFCLGPRKIETLTTFENIEEMCEIGAGVRI